MTVYQNEFSEWLDVVKEFHGIYSADDQQRKELLEKYPEPDDVLYANYDIDGYDGSAFVVWRNGRKYYILEGYHCSCYGLEEAGFDPEEFKTKKLFVAYLKKLSLEHYRGDAKYILEKLGEG